jgi:signal transduction histidine kinase
MKYLAENIGAMVVTATATNPMSAHDGGNATFYEHLGDQVSTLIHNALAFEAQRQRAEALAEIDRVKTAFFSNVSHELRTPLTLILGPIEDALEAPSRSLEGRQLDTVHRNAVRLLKLVNTLLELTRIEAGRSDARFEATDLAALTAGLAASFHTLVESAGLRLAARRAGLCRPRAVGEHRAEPAVERVQVHVRG